MVELASNRKRWIRICWICAFGFSGRNIFDAHFIDASHETVFLNHFNVDEESSRGRRLSWNETRSEEFSTFSWDDVEMKADQDLSPRGFYSGIFQLSEVLRDQKPEQAIEK